MRSIVSQKHDAEARDERALQLKEKGVDPDAICQRLSIPRRHFNMFIRRAESRRKENVA